MSTTTHAEALRAVQGWTLALRQLDRPRAEVLRGARAAVGELDRYAMAPGSETERALTELRAEIAAGEIRALEAQPGDPHYLPGWSGPRDAQGNVGRQTADAEDDAQDLPQLAELLRGADVFEPEAPAWTGWSAPAAALPEETRADLVDRVAGDLDGAADLVTALAAELGVPKAVGDASTVNIARACAGGAATLRALVPVGRGAEPAGERETGTSAPAELQDTLTATRAELAEREAELEDMGEELSVATERETKAHERAKTAERAAADLRSKLAVAEQQRRQALERAERAQGRMEGRVSLIAVLKALGTWAPGFEQMETEELGREAEKVARGVLNEQQTAHAAHQALVRELRDMPGMAARSGSLVERARAVLTEAERAITAHQDCSDEWDESEAVRSAELVVTQLREQLAKVRTELRDVRKHSQALDADLTASRAELAKVRRGQPVPPPSRGFAPHPDAPPASVTTDLRPPAPGAPVTIEGITIPPVRPTPGVTDAPAVAQDGQEPPL